MWPLGTVVALPLSYLVALTTVWAALFFPGHGAATVLIAAVTSLVAGAFRCGTWLEIVTRRAGLLPALVLAPGLLLDALTLAGLPAVLPPGAW